MQSSQNGIKMFCSWSPFSPSSLAFAAHVPKLFKVNLLQIALIKHFLVNIEHLFMFFYPPSPPPPPQWNWATISKTFFSLGDKSKQCLSCTVTTTNPNTWNVLAANSKSFSILTVSNNCKLLHSETIASVTLVWQYFVSWHSCYVCVRSVWNMNDSVWRSKVSWFLFPYAYGNIPPPKIHQWKLFFSHVILIKNS